jgi:hypothetical protein
LRTFDRGAVGIQSLGPWLLEGVLTTDDLEDRERLIQTYFAHARASERGIEDDAYFWAVEAMWDIVHDDADRAWSILCEMLRRAEGDYVIAYVAAGPLENFILRYGWPYIERIEAEAQGNPKFRRALVGVWDAPEGLKGRLRALVQGEPPL